MRALDRARRGPLAGPAENGGLAPSRCRTGRRGGPPADLPAARQRTIAVLGNERSGIPPEAVDLLDTAVEIPMVGAGASLNVAVAGSLVLYRLAGFI